MLIFKFLEVEGFGSIQNPVTIPLHREGLFLVKGENGNGKTTIFSALLWALYQTNLKGEKNEAVATWPHVRRENFRGTRVVLHVDKDGEEYMISRHLNFKGKTFDVTASSKLIVFVRSETHPTGWEPYHGQHKDKQQEFVEELVGMDENTFLNSFLFGQRMKRLIEADNADKRELFDSLFDVAFVDQSRELAKAYITERNMAITKLTTEESARGREIEALKATIANHEDVLRQFSAKKKERVTLVETKIKEAKDNIEEHRTTLNATAAEIEKLPLMGFDEASAAVTTARAELTRVTEIQSKHAFNLRGYDTQLAEIRRKLKDARLACDQWQTSIDNVETTCTVCNSPLAGDKIEAAKEVARGLLAKSEATVTELGRKEADMVATIAAAKVEADGHTKAVEGATIECNRVKAVLDGFAETKRRAESLGNKVQSCKSQISYIEGTLKTLTDDLTREKAAKPPVMDTDKLRKDLAALEATDHKAEIAKEEKLKAQADWWVKRGFGAGGLKSYVFNAMLTQLNILIDKYASRLGISVVFSVDMSKDSKPFITTCYKDGQPVDYKSLSGGQKQRIDISMAFAMHDLISRTSEINALVMDEVFEGLDSKGIEVVFDLIRQKGGEGKAIFIITHNEQIDSLNSSTIQVGVDSNGSTTIH